MWLRDIGFQDPSHLNKKQLIDLCKHWRNRQDELEGVKAFKFKRYINAEGEHEGEEYDAYFERWKAEAPAREANRRIEVAADQRNGTPASVTEEAGAKSGAAEGTLVRLSHTTFFNKNRFI